MNIISFRPFLIATLALFLPILAHAQSDFNPSSIISDPDMQDFQSWGRDDIQKFLDTKGSYLRTGQFPDASGAMKSAADIIYDAANSYQINPKFLVVTLQKEQSLITDDSPSQRQLDWATGYAVCDGCYINDPRVQKYKGFGKQVDGAAGIIRWYYQNQNLSIVKKKDTPIRIDDQPVTPASWATAFLYTYTPHLHGNANFWRIWTTWFDQLYPNGTILQSASTSDYWIVDDGLRRRFKTKTALITRSDPKLAVKVNELDLQKYQIGPEIAFPNYSLLRTDTSTYLLDYDTLRPFASNDVVRALGFNPDELVDVDVSDLSGYQIGEVITASTTAPQGVVIKVSNTKLTYFLKDGLLHPILNQAVIDADYQDYPTEKHPMTDLSQYPTATNTLGFNDGTLIKTKDSTTIYVIDKGLKRPLADDDTFIALGYKKSNIITVDQLTTMNIPTGERIFVSNDLTSSQNKFLGDSEVPVDDLYPNSISASYLIAEYPSGRIISGKNIDTRRPIASLTKLLTSYEALRSDFNLSGTTIYDEKKYNDQGKDTLALKTGDKISNKDIFNTMLIASNNSAAQIVADKTSSGADDLVRKINLRLDEWGADYTSIADVTGLGENNKSTARDLLKIFTKVLGIKTIKDALSSPTYSYRELKSKDKTIVHSFKNSNQIFALPLAKRNYNVLASKTGYTDEAQGVLVMLVQGKKDKKQYIVVTMGNPNYKMRFDEPNKIANWITTQKVAISKK